MSQRLLAEELERRYAYTWIVRIEAIRDEGEGMTWRVDTESGTRELLIEHPRGNIIEIGRDRLRVVDRDGNRFGLSASALDRRSLRLLRESRAASHAFFGAAKTN